MALEEVRAFAYCKALEEVDFRGSGVGDEAARTLATRLRKLHRGLPWLSPFEKHLLLTT